MAGTNRWSPLKEITWKVSTYLSIASKKEAKVFMGALEKKDLVTEAGVNTTLLHLPGTWFWFPDIKQFLKMNHMK